MDSIILRIKEFNKGRIPELLAIKYKNMRESCFRFYRGTSHLFYEDLLSGSSVLDNSPLTWISGDLHVENFGSYKSDNRIVYFDINDFDDSTLAPCLWEISRLLVSLQLVADSMGLDGSSSMKMMNYFIQNYSDTLSNGYARLVQEETAEGIVKDLLCELKDRKRKDLIEKRTNYYKGRQRLVIDDEHALAISEEKKLQISATIEKWASDKEEPKFYKVNDVAYRIAGTGSMGLERYIVLVEGKGTPDQNYLLDLKYAKESPIVSHSKIKQPIWNNQAERIIEIQKRMQAFPLALLDSVNIEGNWFVLKEMLPSQDKVDLNRYEGKLKKIDTFIKTIAEITAWAQLRSGGRQGSAITDSLIDFGKSDSWKGPLLRYVSEYTKQVTSDYLAFCKGYDAAPTNLVE